MFSESWRWPILLSSADQIECACRVLYQFNLIVNSRIQFRNSLASFFSLFCVQTYREICVHIIYSLTEDKPFEYFILLTIFVNCILLAANKPLPKKDKSDLNVELVSIKLGLFLFVHGAAKSYFCDINQSFPCFVRTIS